MNPVLMCFVARNAGWLKKYAKERELEKAAWNIGEILRKSIPYVALATSVGGIGYNVLKDRKIEEMENKRELVGAVNDTLVRQSIGDIYRAAGYPEPNIPMAISKEVSPEYKRVLEQMGKGASEKVAFNPLLLRQLPKMFQRPAVTVMKGMRAVVNNPTVVKGVQWGREMAQKHPVAAKSLALGGIGMAGIGIGRISVPNRETVHHHYYGTRQ